MGEWRGFDDHLARRGLRFGDAPVREPEAEQPFSNKGVKQPRLPRADRTRCLVRHKHPPRKPSELCSCQCPWCERPAEPEPIEVAAEHEPREITFGAEKLRSDGRCFKRRTHPPGKPTSICRCTCPWCSPS
jgi:hypothetical protein